MSDLGASVFLSYSRQDFYLAEEVYVDLRHEGVDVWMDAAEIDPGDPWHHDLKQAIRDADTLLLVATPRSVRSRMVQRELRLAGAYGTPVHVLVAQPFALPRELAALPRHRARLSRPAPMVPLAVAALAFTALIFLGFAAYYLWAAVTDSTGIHRQARWAAVPVLYSDYLISLVAGCLAGAGVIVACAAALIRRRWRVGYVLPLVAACVALQLINIALPMVNVHVAKVGAAAELARVAGPLRAAVLVDAVAAIALVAVLLGSTSVLRRTLTGFGSVLARWRVLRRTDDAFSAPLSLLGDHVPYEEAELGTHLEPPDRVRTFTVVHEVADTPLADQVRSVCGAVGLVEAPASAQADQRLLLVSNTNLHEVLDRDEEGDLAVDVPVLACSLDIAADSELMRRQWVDFRNGELNLREIARVTGRSPKDGNRFGHVVPITAAACRLPLGLLAEVGGLVFVALAFTFVVLSTTYWNLLGARTNSVRLVLAMAIALVAADVVGQVLRRKATDGQVRREQVVLAVLGLAFAAVTWLDDSLWIGFRLLGVVIALGLVTDLFGQRDDLRAWLPVAPARTTPPALGFPLTVTALLHSPHFYAALMLAASTAQVSPL